MPAPKTKAAFIEPMLLLRTAELPVGSDWAYELKLDGYRALAIKSNGQAHLRSRNDNDFNARYPAIVKALAAAGRNGHRRRTGRAGRFRSPLLQRLAESRLLARARVLRVRCADSGGPERHVGAAVCEARAAPSAHLSEAERSYSAEPRVARQPAYPALPTPFAMPPSAGPKTEVVAVHPGGVVRTPTGARLYSCSRPYPSSALPHSYASRNIRRSVARSRLRVETSSVSPRS